MSPEIKELRRDLAILKRIVCDVLSEMPAEHVPQHITRFSVSCFLSGSVSGDELCKEMCWTDSYLGLD